MQTFEPAPLPTPVPPTKDHTRLVLGIGVGLIVVALIGLGALLLPRLIGGASSTSLTAAALPDKTQFFVSFNPHFNQLPNGDVIGKAWQASTKTVEDEIRKSLSDVKLDWDTDIAPWLGDEVGLGMWNLPLNVTGSAPASTPPSLVFVLATRDPTKSDALLTKLRDQAASTGTQFNEATYRGIATVEQANLSQGEPSAFATVNNLVIIATGTDDLHATIDAVLDKKGLDQFGSYQDTLSKLHGGRAVTAYLDLEPFMKLAMDQASTWQSLTADEKAVVEAIQAVGLGLSFEPNGLRLEMLLTADANKLPLGQLGALQGASNANKLLQTVPDSTFLYIGGEKLSTFFDSFLQSLQAADPSIASSLRTFERQANIDLSNDLFNWMTGEFTLVGMPGAIGSSAGQIPFGIALLVTPSDKQLAETNADKFFHAVADQAKLKIDDMSVSGATLHALLDTSGNPTLVYGILNDNFILALSQDAVKRIGSASSSPLAGDATFKAATAPLPSGNGGFVLPQHHPVLDVFPIRLAASRPTVPVPRLAQDEEVRRDLHAVVPA